MPGIAVFQLKLHMSKLPPDKDSLSDSLLSSDENDAAAALISSIDSFLQSLGSSQQDSNNSLVTKRIQANVKENDEGSPNDSIHVSNSEQIDLDKRDTIVPASFNTDPSLKRASSSREMTPSTTLVSNETVKVAAERDRSMVEKRKSDDSASLVYFSKNKTDRQRNSQSSPNYSSFPFTLFLLLEEASIRGYEQIVSWQPHGRSFRVHNQTAFVTSVMPQYFQQTRFSSFQRQLALYGFVRCNNKGLDQGAYYHRHFLRGYPQLCSTIQRTPIKGTGFQRQMVMNSEPDFYQMHSVASLPQASNFLAITDPLVHSMKAVPTTHSPIDDHSSSTKVSQPYLPLMIPVNISRNENLLSGQPRSEVLIPNSKLPPSFALQDSTSQAIQPTKEKLFGSNTDVILDRIGRGISILQGEYQAPQTNQYNNSLGKNDIKSSTQETTIHSIILPPSDDAFDRIGSLRLGVQTQSISNFLLPFASLSNEQQDIITTHPIVEMESFVKSELNAGLKGESEEENSTLASFLADVDLDSDHEIDSGKKG